MAAQHSGYPSPSQPYGGPQERPGHEGDGPQGYMGPQGHMGYPPMSSMPPEPGMSGRPGGSVGGKVLVAFAVLVGIAALIGGLIFAMSFYEKPSAEDKRLAERTTTRGKIDQEMIDQTMAFTVTGVQCGIPTVGEGTMAYPARHGQFCQVTLRITNRRASGAVSFFVLEQQLRTDEGMLVEPDSSATYRVDGNVSDMVQPGQTVTRTLVYDIPTAATPVELRLNDRNFEREGGVTVDLR